MSTFEVVAQTPLAPDQAWHAVTDWRRHGRHVPLTRVQVTRPTGGHGEEFTASTALGPLRLDDAMRVTHWQPPGPQQAGVCVIEKTGRGARGGARIEVEAVGPGSRVRWREEVSLGPVWFSRLTDPVAAVPGRAVFGRVVRGLLRDAEREAGLRA